MVTIEHDPSEMKSLPTSPKNIDHRQRIFSPDKDNASSFKSKYDRNLPLKFASKESRALDSTRNWSGSPSTPLKDYPSQNFRNKSNFENSFSTNHNSQIPKSPIGEGSSKRRYVANVIERDLFRSTFMSPKKDEEEAVPNIKRVTPLDNEAPSYRRRRDLN